MVKKLAYVALAAVLGVAAVAWQWPQLLPAWLPVASTEATKPAYATEVAAKGDVRRVVATSGPVSAVVTVLVGSQLSGQIEAVLADYNTEVKAGDVLARIDPQTFQSKVDQAKADLAAAEAGLLLKQANLAKAKAVLAQAKKSVERNATLARKRLTAEANLETATRDAAVAEADISVSEADIANANAVVAQRKAALGQAEIDLTRTVVRAPIEGTVISRTIDVGQTVAASLQAPELFRIAQDLSNIQIEAQVNEADIGNIAPGNPVTFTVDAYPDRSFTGSVEQVRLAASIIQNVVTYTVIITSKNADRRLYPGMTANATIETGVREDVLKVPNEALRFRPRESTGGDGASRGADRSKRMIAQAAQSIGLTEAQTADLTARMQAAMAELRPKGSGLTQQRDPSRSREVVAQRFEQELSAILTADQRPAFETWKKERESTRSGTVYVLGPGGTPEPRFVRTGLSDDSGTEITAGDLKPGETIILRLIERPAP
ncbi:MAG: efflux RND transporter periplasmic adaptor subunit [Hyphomicrobiaceae bacterium]